MITDWGHVMEMSLVWPDTHKHQWYDCLRFPAVRPQSDSMSSSSSSVPFTWAWSVAASVSDKNKSSKSCNIGKHTYLSIKLKKHIFESLRKNCHSYVEFITSVSDLSGIKLSTAISSSDDSIRKKNLKSEV